MTAQTSIIAKQAETAGVSPELADAYIALQAAAAQQPAVVTGDVEAILGRPATPFAQWVDNQRDLFSN
ncbi:MAG: hypothetical protein WCB92_15730 [Mycobacterium sp.]